MDMNMVILTGRLAAPAEVRKFDSGATCIRFILTVRTDNPRRVDVVPVTLWGERGEDLHEIVAMNPGVHVWVTGQTQRRFWDSGDGRRSRLEIVATEVTIGKGNDDE